MVGDLVRESWRALGANRMRSALTMLGMVIGVGAVVLMMAIGQGAQYMVNQAIESMGSNLFIVLSGATTSGGMRFGAGSTPTLTLADANAIAELPAVAAVAPVVPGTAQIVYGPNNWSTLVHGTTPSYFSIRDWQIAAGQIFEQSDVRSAARVAVIGQTVVTNLFPPGVSPVGKTIRIANAPYQVIGVLAPKGQSLDGRDQDDSVLVPVTTAQRKLFGDRFPGTVRFMMAQATGPTEMNRAQQEMELLLRQRHHIGPGEDDDFSIRNLTALAKTASSAAGALSFMLGAIASISLLVGGIGIMNIMLVSVTERTREIGIRMAIGARPADVLTQFLLEALSLSILGSLVGVLLGVGFAWTVTRFVPMTVVVTVWAIALAFIVAAGIGIFFGLYPARKAARLKPIEALRYE
ncbi:MAG: ABC transporter permease [Gammaproteobacteria bacterium]